MGPFADHLVASHPIGALTEEGLRLYVVNLRQSRRRGHNLEDGARDIGRLGKPVYIDALIVSGAVILQVRHVVRVIGGRGNGAENLAGLVIVYPHHSLAAVQCLQGGLLGLGADGEHRCASGARGGVHAIDQIKSHHLAAVFRYGRGADIALPISQQVESSQAHSPIIAVSPAIGGVQEDGAGPVCNHAAIQVASPVHMRAAGKHHPLLGLKQIFSRENHKAQHQNGSQDQNKSRAARNSIHTAPPPFYAMASEWQSWRSAWYPPP